ncbi:hypothetical protein [Arcticibacterium luteifluviistationis]|nr:hypothetical protein [Arcticibacterium luteifluviistationis]
MKKKNIFKIAFLVFVGIVILLLLDMARHTTAPWNKDKQIESAVKP